MKSAIFAILFLGLVAISLGQLIAPAYHTGYYGSHYYGAPIATYGAYSGYSPYYGGAVSYGYPGAYGYSSLLLKK